MDAVRLGILIHYALHREGFIAPLSSGKKAIGCIVKVLEERIDSGEVKLTLEKDEQETKDGTK